MILNNSTLNGKAPADTNCEGLRFVLTATTRLQEKGMIDDFLYHGGARVNER